MTTEVRVSNPVAGNTIVVTPQTQAGDGSWHDEHVDPRQGHVGPGAIQTFFIHSGKRLIVTELNEVPHPGQIISG